MSQDEAGSGEWGACHVKSRNASGKTVIGMQFAETGLFSTNREYALDIPATYAHTNGQLRGGKTMGPDFNLRYLAVFQFECGFGKFLIERGCWDASEGKGWWP